MLKVNGRFFGADKIQNEVACLRLLHHYCPSVATPRALAWSENGSDMTIADPTEAESKNVKLQVDYSNSDFNHGGWILMSRVPGESASRFNLDTEALKTVMVQLADIITLFRTQIPLQRYVGNLQHEASSQDSELSIGLGRNELHLSIRGVLFDGIQVTQTINNPGEYHKIKVQEKIHELQTKEVFSPNNHLVPKLETFLNETLPRLNRTADISNKDRYIFTHFDISPRNVLISDFHEITGIVDFEFSGFFDELDEYLNDYAANLDDWGNRPYQAYLDRLSANGVKTPTNGIDRKRWEEARCLDRLLENIAPWWLPGDKEGEALEGELRQASDIVLASLNELSAESPITEPTADSTHGCRQ